MTTPQGQPETPVLKIYLLTRLTEEERTAYLSKLQRGIESDGGGGSIKLHLVDWPAEQEADGSVEGGDLLRLYKQHEAEEYKAADPDGAALFQYFADRQSVDTDTVIQADRDWYTLICSDGAEEEITKLVEEDGGISLSEVDWHVEGAAETFGDDLLRRGVTWGRIPVGGLWSSWCNLDLGNMGADEIIELFGGSMAVSRDPGWDAGVFLEKVREEVRKMKEEQA